MKRIYLVYNKNWEIGFSENRTYLYQVFCKNLEDVKYEILPEIEKEILSVITISKYGTLKIEVEKSNEENFYIYYAYIDFFNETCYTLFQLKYL